MILSIFSYDGKKRPTLEQIREHPWLQKNVSHKVTRQNILEKLQELRSSKTADTSEKAVAGSRGDGDMLELVRQTTAKNLDLFKFNDMTDHDIDISPGNIIELLNEFNCEYFESQLSIESNFDKKFVQLSKADDFTVKITFLDLAENADKDEEEAIRYRMRLVMKKGDRSKWYEAFQTMQDTVFEDVLLAPRAHQAEVLTTASDDE